MRTQALVMMTAAALAALSTSAIAGPADDYQGLVASPRGLLSPNRVQGRLGITTSTPSLGSIAVFPNGLSAGAGRIENLSLMGDYYFGAAPGGLRATGGVMLGSHGPFWSALPSFGPRGLAGFSAERRSYSLANPGFAADTHDYLGGPSAVPYLGVGYTGLLASSQHSAALRGGWGFSADLGLMALSPRLGYGPSWRNPYGQPNLDEAVRELRFAPVLQLGLSYSF